MSGMDNFIKEREYGKRNYPMLLLTGEHDTELALNAAKEWHEKEKTSHFSLIKDAGHCANMDNPEMFNKILLDFISK